MATARLVPSAYSTSGSASVSDASNMYTNTDSDTYATLTASAKDTGTYYVYIKGFNFGSIPSGATVSSFTVKIKGYESRNSTGSSYAPCLVNGTSTISGATASDSFHSSIDTLTISTGSMSWSTLSGYGSNLGVRVPIKRSNKNQQAYVYVYGVEIEVTYTEPVVETDKLYIKVNGSWVEASAVYKKVSGSWVQQSDLTAVFDSGTNYKYGG